MDYKSVIAENISKVTELPEDQIFKLIETPPQKDLGDFAFPCFILAKSLHKAPAMISEELAGNESLTHNGMFSVKNAGPYLNFYIDRSTAHSSVSSLRLTGSGAIRTLSIMIRSLSFFESTLSSMRKPRRIRPLTIRPVRTSRSSRTAVPRKSSCGRSSVTCHL